MASAELSLKREAIGVVGDNSGTDRSMEPHELDELLTVDEVAALLKVSRSWIYEHTRKRGTPRSSRLPHVKIGKYVRFEPRAVREFVARLSRIA
jgi:excisionase family DNA binding protein